MFYEKTIKLISIILFALILLWMVLVYGMKNELIALFGIESNLNAKLAYILAVLVWTFMYFVFSLITSKLALGISARLSNNDFLRVYAFYKFFLSQEARMEWQNNLKLRGLI